ncbi:DIS3-like exonuclease 2 [Argentina anserina]|uniref:DIS3-like exonuclease 2 n=1 Tax=Argentina anserina TaxID=57926 RepID=UPI0021767073|nr:DIS3-like exonuclease 2 [Potentilla anserina]
MKAAVVEAVADRADDGDKEKKKRRPRNRKSKQSPSSPSVSCSSVNGDASLDCLGNGTMTNHVTASLNQHHLGTSPLCEQGLPKASNLAFSSLPTMHIVESPGAQSPGSRLLLPSDFDGRMFANSCPEPAACGGSPGILTNKGSSPQHLEGYFQKRYISPPPHWSMEDVSAALEKGDVFKALFRVNAHNRNEAYCKIDGVPTDILIGGLMEQNRAVEGDIVAIKIDPLPLWTKMKGSTSASKSSASVEVSNNNPEDDAVGSNCKGKAKVDENCEYDGRRSCVLLESEFCPEGSMYLHDSTHSESVGQSSCDHVAGKSQLASGSSNEQNVIQSPVQRICSIISSFPSKRPTGRVVAIIEWSKCRDTVIGYLNVQKWISYRQFCKKDMKKNKSLSYSDHEYIQMTPTDPRFPKMVVLVRKLPEAIKKRLENGDETIEKELFAAQVDEWAEGSLAPQALILHAFGHGTEVQPHIEAILFENAINSSEFSPESLSCLPRLPWEFPQEELKIRKDLRNLCIFTIDPSTATDLDDALSVENFSNGISRVGVHIADASYFVLPDTPLDEEAQARSTSVYMTQRKIPMLPPILTENIGSLNPGVERLTFSVFLDINNAGDVVDRWMGRTVIRSCCKLSYEHAQDIIDGKLNSESFDTFKDGYPQVNGHFGWSDVIRSVKSLYEISKILKKRRFNDGALQLDNSKVVILFDECGDPYDSLFSERKESNSLVEEFMLLANITVAEVISRAFPDSALLRRHPEPNMRKLKELEAFCAKNGLQLDTSSSGRFHQSLERIREKLKDDSVLFNILMNYATKPMQLATYFCSGELKHKENDWGHYGLAVPLYTHFTSPLRRYPDIVVHRTLAAAIEAEELYLEQQRLLNNLNKGDKFKMRCFTGVHFDKDAAQSWESQKALSAAAMKHSLPSIELLAGVAAYCNDRKLASRHVKDSCDKLHMWSLLKKKEIFSEARVMGLGPRFMSIYIQRLGVERRISYDEVEGLMVEWLEATSTLVLSLRADRRSFKRGSPGKWRDLEDVALVVNPSDLEAEPRLVGKSSNEQSSNGCSLNSELAPMVFPLTMRILSTISVVLHAVGGDDGPVDIGARLYISSYI